ncbi:MAG: hypothetical protein ACE5OZ_25510 [Candidatus Heimdallarchaeota archaeon]
MGVQDAFGVVLDWFAIISGNSASFLTRFLFFRELLDELPIIVGVLQVGQYQTPAEGPFVGIKPHSAQPKGFINANHPLGLIDFVGTIAVMNYGALCL